MVTNNIIRCGDDDANRKRKRPYNENHINEGVVCEDTECLKPIVVHIGTTNDM